MFLGARPAASAVMNARLIVIRAAYQCITGTLKSVTNAVIARNAIKPMMGACIIKA